MKGEDIAGTGLGVEAVGEAGFDARRLVGEWKGIVPARQAFGKALGVLA